MLGNQSFHGGASETPVRSSIPNSNQTASTRGGCLAMEARVLRLHAPQIGKLVDRLEQPFVRILPGSEEFEQRIQLRSICKRLWHRGHSRAGAVGDVDGKHVRVRQRSLLLALSVSCPDGLCYLAPELAMVALDQRSSGCVPAPAEIIRIIE